MGNLRIRVAAVIATAATATALLAAPVEAQVDTRPPPVGSCHSLSRAEAFAGTEPDPAVACSARHTTVTVGILRFANPDYNAPAFMGRAWVGCHRRLIRYFGGRIKGLRMAAYASYFFFPTNAQIAAGATWVRCDVGIYARRGMPTLPGRSRPPLREGRQVDRVARCYAGERADFERTVCTQAHVYKSWKAIKYPGRTYPGLRRLKEFAKNQCRKVFPRSAYFYNAMYSTEWKAGYRHIVCGKKTTRGGSAPRVVGTPS